MTRQEHLMVIGMEECNEVAQRLSKALRFGLDEIQPGQPLTNRQRIEQEYADLVATLLMLSLHWNAEAVEAKQRKIERFLAYSAERGTLQAERVEEPRTPQLQDGEPFCINHAGYSGLSSGCPTCRPPQAEGVVSSPSPNSEKCYEGNDLARVDTID